MRPAPAALIAKLHAKGLDKFLAYEIPIKRCQDLYGFTYRDIAADLQDKDDIRVLDFDGRRIFLDFSLMELGDLFVYEAERMTRAA